MKSTLFLPGFLLALLPALFAQVPATWSSRGIGGGGALFSPAINPADHQELYIACDMSELFHSTDQGKHWQELPFQATQGGHRARVQFTDNPAIRYGVDYTSVNGIDYQRPVKSTDGGLSWKTLPGNPDPTESTLGLFAAYQHPNDLILSYYGAVYASTDGGQSFSQIHTALSNGSGCHVGGVFWDDAKAYIGTNDGLLVYDAVSKSVTTLPATGIPAGQYVTSFAGARQGNALRFFCLTATDVYAGIEGWDYYGFAKGVYRMDNASGTWQVAQTGINISTDFAFFVGMAENNINTAYLAGGSDSGDPIILKTVNGGQQWNNVLRTGQNQNIVTGWMGYQGDRQWSYEETALGFTVCADDADALLFTGYGMAHLSTDGGAHWKQLYVEPADQHPENAATPKGNYYHGNGLENTSCWQLHWSDAAHLLAAYSDIHGIQSADGGASWRFIPNLSHNSIYRIEQHPDGRIFAATSTVHDMYQSTYLADSRIDNGTGALWVSADQGQSFSLLHDFQHPVLWIALDPANAKRMYAAVAHSTQGGIYRTDNLDAGQGSTWIKCANPPRTEGHAFNIRVLNDGAVVCTFSGRRNTQNQFTNSSGVFISTNQGQSWQDVSHAGMHWWTKDLVVDPHDPAQNTWYAAVFSGWANVPAGTGGLYRTTNRGQSWQQISSSYRVNSATVSPTDPNQLYFTTETDGLWHTANLKNAAPTFERVESYPFRHPVRVFFNPFKSDNIWVSSFGAGLKAATVSGGTPVFEPAEGAAVQLSISPNPARDMVRLTWPDPAPAPDAPVRVFDSSGRLIRSARVEASGQSERSFLLRLPACPAGVYRVEWGRGIGRLVLH